MLQEIVDDA